MRRPAGGVRGVSWSAFAALTGARRSLILLVLLTLLPGSLLPHPARAQTATDAPSDAGEARTNASGPSPRKALLRAALLPGWGQIYNRQFYKLPFVYGGLGGLVAGVVYMNDRYLLYRHAYLYARNPESYPQYADEAAPFQRIIESGQEDLLRRQRENFQRNRDLFVLGVGLYYGLTVLDAFVSAHLRDFDVSEDLTVHLRATTSPEGVARFAPALTWRF
ncbi:MAG: hypothetical protein D6685_03950 [Bacteroidetes bacterium]|nr:MAG: hypothetical protein D6685_03950 [Bacteroidota bacterium]